MRSNLTSEVSPPPINSKIQDCLLEYKYEKYLNKEKIINLESNNLIKLNFQSDKKFYKSDFIDLGNKINETFKIIENLKGTEKDYNNFTKTYKVLHLKVRKMQKKIIKSNLKIEELEKELRREDDIISQQKINEEINKEIKNIQNINKKIPKKWIEENKKFKNILLNYNNLKLSYNKNVDKSYEKLTNYIQIFEEVDNLSKIYKSFDILINNINNSPENIIEDIKTVEKKLNAFSEVNEIKKYLKKSRKKLKKNINNKNESIKLIEEGKILFKNEISYRKNGKKNFLKQLIKLEILSRDNFGLRKQDKLTKKQAIYIASCKAKHKDISLNF